MICINDDFIWQIGLMFGLKLPEDRFSHDSALSAPIIRIKI